MYKIVSQTGSTIEIATPPSIRMLTLFSYDHKVTIDQNAETVTIFRQVFFIGSTTTLSFDSCWYIDYGYEATHHKHGSTDYYTITLVTRDEKRYPIITVQGEDSTHMMAGIHLATGSDDEARDLVTLISQVTGAPIGKPIAEDMDKKECVSCGRSITAISKKCLYCGTVQEA